MKGNHHMKWMKSAMEIGTFVMSLMFACILFSLFYFSILNSASNRITRHTVSTVELKVQPSSVLEENNNTSVSEMIVGIEEQNSSALGENNQVSQTAEIEQVKTRIIKPLCTSNYLSKVCEIQGDQIRIHGISSSVYFNTDTKKNKTWRVQPYPRKYDTTMMTKIPEVKITHLYDPQNTSKCEINHNITAVIFAIGGYTGNFYHDFSDVLVPLFVTARQFEGEVQFFMANFQLWWVDKYSQILNKLSNYDIINLEKENNTHCYPRVIVGLYSHKHMSMDPSITPNNYSAVDFTKFLRSVYSLERDFPISLRENPQRKPRLLIIPRKSSRSLTNMDTIVPMAEELGFEVASNEPSFHTNVGDFARIVNSFDVLMGVHGAGLTNLVFLPTKAVVIQIVPFGNLEWMCDRVFGAPARDMKLKYLQYSISEEESTLREKYARDDPVFRDPDSLHKQGWNVMASVYLSKQHVELNTTRFRPILEKARELLN